jgi:membrane protein implicated in regulation of membrane protease activity
MLDLLGIVVIITWVIVIAIALIVEMTAPAFFSLWFGVGGIVALVSVFLGASIPVQWVIFLVVSTTGVLLSRKFYKVVHKPSGEKFSIDGWIGKKAVVSRKVDSIQGNGLVMFNGRLFRAIPIDDNHTFEENTNVKVVRIEGVSLVVDAFE